VARDADLQSRFVSVLPHIGFVPVPMGLAVLRTGCVGATRHTLEGSRLRSGDRKRDVLLLQQVAAPPVANAII